MKKLLLCSLLILGACSVKDAPTPEAPEAPTPEAPETKKPMDVALDDAKTQLPAEALDGATIFSLESTTTTGELTTSRTTHVIISSDGHFSLISASLKDGTDISEEKVYDKEIISKNAISYTLEEISPIPIIDRYTPQSGDKYYKSTPTTNRFWNSTSIDLENSGKWLDGEIGPIEHFIIRQTDSKLRIMDVYYFVSDDKYYLDVITEYKKI